MALQELVCISPFTLISSTCDASVSHPSFLLSQCIPPEDSVPTKQCQEGWVASLGEAVSCSLRLWQLDEWDSHQGLWHAVHFRDLVSYLHKKWGSQRKYFRNADLLSYLNSHLSLSLFSFSMLGLFGSVQWVKAELTHNMWDLSFPTRDRVYAPCIGKQILNHWTTRDVPSTPILELLHLCFSDI